jgi:hypothetical protein
MGTTVVGILLLIIGFVALLAGIGGGVAQMFKDIQKQFQAGQSGLFSFPTQTLEALTKFIEALTKAPLWLALTILGILLIAWGGSML